MRRRKEEYKQNNFNGNVNFIGKTQIAAGDIINNISEEKQKTANYDPEPKWRSLLFQRDEWKYNKFRYAEIFYYFYNICIFIFNLFYTQKNC